MRFLAVIFTYLSLLSYASASNDISVQMLDNNKRVHSLISELIQIAEQRVAKGIRDGDDELNQAVRGIIRKENNVDVLASLAIALRGYSFNSLAGTEEVFFVYDVAWDCAILRIEEIGSREALSNLLMMRGSSLHDGASSLRLTLSIEKLESKQQLQKSEKAP